MSSSDTAIPRIRSIDKIKIKTSSGMVPIENFVNWASRKVGTIKRLILKEPELLNRMSNREFFQTLWSTK